MVTALLLLAASTMQQPALADLEKLAATAAAEKDYYKAGPIYESIHNGALQLIESNRLASGEDFLRTGQLMAVGPPNFQLVQVQYELFLSALVAGEKRAADSIGLAWDSFLMAIDRGRRIGVTKMKVTPGMERFRLSPTAKCIRRVYLDPKSAQKAAIRPDNPTVQSLVHADQKAREMDFSKITQKELLAMMHSDISRLKQIKQITRNGGLFTAKDFANAALVCQHGTTFEDFALAHELTVCSMILGNVSASWLAGASYDRLLTNVGLPQRFATQFTNQGAGLKLERVDTFGINETMRKLVVHRTLEEVRNVKF